MRPLRPQMAPSTTMRRRGFVLLLVLALIATCGLYAAGTARTSMAAVLESAARQQDLQDHWARRSLTSVVLRNASRVLMPPGRATEVRTSLQHTITLGGTAYRLVLADEDAKLPVNTVRRVLDQETAERLVRTLCPGGRLRTRDDRQTLFGSWPEALTFERGTASPGELSAATRNVTLWGSGRLNVNRARPEIVAALVTETLGSQTADRLLEILGRGRVASVENLATQLALNLEQRQKLEALVSTSSDAYSLWILPAGKGRAEFHVNERHSQRSGGVVSLLW